MSKKYTAVEWLIDKVEDHFCLLPVDLIEQAKEMEKEQIVDACYFGSQYLPYDVKDKSEEYYTETYEK